jgi:hypothetical protein
MLAHPKEVPSYQPHQNTPQLTSADDTAVLATDCVPAIASQKLQTNLAAIQYWFKKIENKS